MYGKSVVLFTGFLWGFRPSFGGYSRPLGSH